jgi:hypothetical protein
MRVSNYDSPRIIDAFLANDELELAQFRISYLACQVDLVVIGESNVTFQGSAKPLYFRDWLAQIPNFSNTVKIVSLKLFGDDAWQRESSAREALLEFLIENYPDAGYIISDLDEIPSRSQIAEMRRLSGDYHFQTPTFYRKANWSTRDWNWRWNKGVFTTRSEKRWPNAGRHEKLPLLQSHDLGCHFSYLGFDSKQMQKKLSSFSHVELDSNLISNQAFLNYCDKFMIDHLGRIDSDSFGLLHQLTFDELPSVARDLFYFRPEFFDFAPSNERLFKRLIASSLVSLVTRKSHLSDDAFRLILGSEIPHYRKLFVYARCSVAILKSFLFKKAREVKRSFGVRK